MLKHKIFAEGISKQIKDYFPPDYADVECTVIEKRKNNGAVMVGLAFRKPGEQVSPVIYVEPFYQQMCQGKPMDEVLGKIAETAWEAMERNHFSKLPDMGEYEKVKGYLEVQIVNTRANWKELKGLPHWENEDLSVMPVIKLPFPERDSCGKVKISNELIELWQVSADEVMDQAWENMGEKEPPTLRGMGDILHELKTGHAVGKNLLEETNPVQDGQRETAYVLSNKSGMDGAAYLASAETMEKIYELFPEGFYLLPSSVHQIIVMPKGTDNLGQGLAPLELGRMVRAVNQTEVKREEILSDRVYEYDREKGKIRQVPESIEKERGMER